MAVAVATTSFAETNFGASQQPSLLLFAETVVFVTSETFVSPGCQLPSPLAVIGLSHRVPALTYLWPILAASTSVWAG